MHRSATEAAGLQAGPLAGPKRLGLLVAVFILAAASLVGVFQAAERYGDGVLVTRYCANPEATVEMIGRILADRRPAGDQSRRPYIIAAKLIYLVPRHEGESLAVYQNRLRQHIERRCR